MANGVYKITEEATTDFEDLTSAELLDVKNEIFSEDNLNKMESKLGTRWRENRNSITLCSNYRQGF